MNKGEESKNQPRKLWQTLKNIGASSKLNTISKYVGLKIENEICFDKSKVAEKKILFNRCLISAQKVTNWKWQIMCSIV